MSGNPAKRSWEPMRRGTPNPLSPMVQAALNGGHYYNYRSPELSPTGVEAWANRLYNGVLVWFNDGSGHFSFKRHDRSAIRDWRHVQSIKNEVAGPDREGIEIYPPEDMLVDGANEYHLWILPPDQMSPLGFAGRSVLAGMDNYDAAAHRAGSSNPGGRQREWEPGLSTGPNS
jgi:hypothetical protein